MEMIDVKSSNIKAIGWFNKVLFVEFLAGTLYTYFNVPKEVFNDFLFSSSKGKYLNANIKNAFRFQKV